MTAFDKGFSLLEVMCTLSILGILTAIVMPGFVRLDDLAALNESTTRLADVLRDSQLAAEEYQSFQEVRFAPFGTTYSLFGGNGTGYYGGGSYMPPIVYTEGYLHLPEPNVRYDDVGNISESGRIQLQDPQGDSVLVLLHLGFGAITVQSARARV